MFDWLGDEEKCDLLRDFFSLHDNENVLDVVTAACDHFGYTRDEMWLYIKWAGWRYYVGFDQKFEVIPG